MRSISSRDGPDSKVGKTDEGLARNLPYATWGRSRSLRLRDFDYASPGVAYHIVVGSHRSRDIFTEQSLNRRVIGILKTASRLHGYDLLAYCLMPDHLHVLVQAGESPRNLRDFVRRFKSFSSATTRSVATPVATKIMLWQRGFYEHIIRKDEDVGDVADYIMGNPARKGLALEGQQYEWCELIERSATS